MLDKLEKGKQGYRIYLTISEVKNGPRRATLFILSKTNPKNGLPLNDLAAPQVLMIDNASRMILFVMSKSCDPLSVRIAILKAETREHANFATR